MFMGIAAYAGVHFTVGANLVPKHAQGRFAATVGQRDLHGSQVEYLDGERVNEPLEVHGEFRLDQAEHYRLIAEAALAEVNAAS